MHYGGEKLGKEWSDFDPQRKSCYCWGSGLWCKVSSKLSGICDRRRGDRQKDRHTDTGDFIICPMLCYSNGADNNHYIMGGSCVCLSRVCVSVCRGVTPSQAPSVRDARMRPLPPLFASMGHPPSPCTHPFKGEIASKTISTYIMRMCSAWKMTRMLSASFSVTLDIEAELLNRPRGGV